MIRKREMRSTCIALALLAASSVPVLAGPPLVCHRLDIGSARSLPWGTDSASWDQTLASYNLANLAGETLALLSPQTPVIVRMETIRRAAIYARRSPGTAKELILKLSARAHDAEAQGHPDALAMFDYGYLIETTKEVGWAYHASEADGGQSNVAMHLDGYPWVTRALAAGRGDPQMEFAAALIVLERSDLKSHREHAQKALAAEHADSLLARNLTAFFTGTRGDTMTALLARSAKAND
ncbi:MAG TPA: hypothetical protein VMI94_15735 [Bryobacteraceae bacterium]|nr:hypothetical protein [Bryobacteraceae bacterium]